MSTRENIRLIARTPSLVILEKMKYFIFNGGVGTARERKSCT